MKVDPEIPNCALLPTMGTDPETTITTMFKERKAKLKINQGTKRK